MAKKEVTILVNQESLSGILEIPDEAQGIVLFVHGSGSSRLSPRNQSVAQVLQQGGIATLLFDLLTPKEEQIDDMTAKLRFDIPMLAGRTIKAVEWTLKEVKGLKIGLFGASTGAAAALIAAAKKREVAAVVSRGGRPDLALTHLGVVSAPTLLLVGGDDGPVIEMNQTAYDALSCEKKLSIIPGATHLFEEPGKLEEVCKQALGWFQEHLK